jgi:hypothetical protein
VLAYFNKKIKTAFGVYNVSQWMMQVLFMPLDKHLLVLCYINYILLQPEITLQLATFLASFPFSKDDVSNKSIFLFCAWVGKSVILLSVIYQF